MDRTSGLYYQTVGGKRQFTNGPPGTRVEQVFLNGVQEELATFIENTGLIPSASDNTQIQQALCVAVNAGRTGSRMSWSSVSAINVNVSPFAYQVNGYSSAYTPAQSKWVWGGLTWTWAASGHNKGLDTGVEQASKWYYLYAFNDAGVLGVVASLTAPNMLYDSVFGGGSYQDNVYLGAFYNNSGGNIVKFYQQNGATFAYAKSVFPGATTTNNAATQVNIGVPTTANVALVKYTLSNSTTATCDSYLSTSAADVYDQLKSTTINTVLSDILLVPMQTQGSLWINNSTAGGSDLVALEVLGWIDKYL